MRNKRCPEVVRIRGQGIGSTGNGSTGVACQQAGAGIEGVIGHARSHGSVPRVRAVHVPEMGGLPKSTNIQLRPEVPNGGKVGVAGGVAESACSKGGVYRYRAVPGAEIYHFEKM